MRCECLRVLGRLAGRLSVACMKMLEDCGFNTVRGKMAAFVRE